MKYNYNSLLSAFCSAQLLVESFKDGDDFPDLRGRGLCYLLSDGDQQRHIYDAMSWIDFSGSGYVSDRGQWDDARMNLLALLAVCEPEDFFIKE